MNLKGIYTKKSNKVALKTMKLKYKKQLENHMKDIKRVQYVPDWNKIKRTGNKFKKVKGYF